MDLEKQINKLTQYFLEAPKQVLNRSMPPGELKELINLDLNSKSENPESLDRFIESYLKYSVNTSHSLYTNQLWSKVEPISILGEYLASITNTSMYTYEVAPVATLLEDKMIQYLTQIIWDAPKSGVMSSGGTASNMQALLCAKHHHFPEAKEHGLTVIEGEPVVLTASNCHYSIKRAVNILGLGHKNLIEVEVNKNGQMEAESLDKQIKTLKANGKKPFCVVSTAGSTIEGSFDDIDSISKVCLEHGLWLHIDAAYGGSVMLSDKHKKLTNGIQAADSVSWDFHKILGINLPCAFLFTKDKNVLKNSLTTNNDSYLFHAEESLDLGTKSLQCGRKNDILKLWLYWQQVGKEGLALKVDNLFSRAQEFAQLITKDSRFELLSQPQSINVCFRLLNKTGTRQEDKIREALLKSGKLMINYSNDSSGPFFRMAITNPNLNTEHLIEVLELIKITADEIK